MRLRHTVTKKGSCVCDAWLVWCGACGRAPASSERAEPERVRRYFLMEGKKQERMIHVSSMIRIQGLLFSPGPAGPAGRVNRRETVKLYYLSRDTHNTIEASCYE